MTLILSNDDVEKLLTMRECIEVMEEAYIELAEGRGVSRTRSDCFTPTARADALYSLKSMDGVIPKLGIGAVRINSDIILVHRGRASLSEGAPMRQTLRASKLIATVTAIALATPAAAQDWPPRTTTIVLGLGPGSGLDLFARVIVDALQSRLGTNFVIDYRVGAAGNIAVDAVARSAPDGSVLAGAIAAPIVTNHMFMKLNIDPMKELAPVTVLGTTPSVVIASKKSGARTLPDFIAMLKKDPEKYSFSSVGIGTTGHLSAELIALKSGTKMVHVPYKSTPEAMQAVITGEVDLATLTVNLAEPTILADRVTGIAITSAQRWPTLPDVPTIAEGGIPEMPVDAWFGLFAPRADAAGDHRRDRPRGARDRANPRCAKADRRRLLPPGRQHTRAIRRLAAPGAGDVEAGDRRPGLAAAVGCGHHDQPRPPADRIARVV
jgi:tripartite-type tricarboxylate transporter receptor subunit TctC